MIKLIIWFVSFWKPFNETFCAWKLVVIEDEPSLVFWLDLSFFRDNDWWEFYEDDYSVQTVIRKLKLQTLCSKFR